MLWANCEMNDQNLKPFKKGKDKRRNLKGKPVGTLSMTKLIREYLLEIAKDGETHASKLKRAIVLRAITKSDVLAKEILDRMDGKVVQPTDITSGGKPIGEKSITEGREAVSKFFNEQKWKYNESSSMPKMWSNVKSFENSSVRW